MDDIETTESLRAQAQELRDQAAALRTEQETILATAQQEADRLLAEARQAANQLGQSAQRTDREAEQVQGRCQYFIHRDALATDSCTMAATIADLNDEAETLRQQIDGLDEQLADLEAERQLVEDALTVASETGDIDGAVTARARLSAMGDVIAARQRQRAAASTRWGEIGQADGPGELGQATSRYGALQAEMRRVRNLIDPTRPEAVLDLELERLSALAAHAMEQQRDKPAPRTQTIIRN